VSGPGRPTTVHLGARAEEAAHRFLEAQGLVPWTRNYRCGAGEIDLIMLDGETLVFAEVRYRERPDPVDPAVTVTRAKRKRIARTAAHFLQRQPRFRDHAVRFDVLSVTGPLARARCEWIRGAFTLDDLAWS